MSCLVSRNSTSFLISRNSLSFLISRNSPSCHISINSQSFLISRNSLSCLVSRNSLSWLISKNSLSCLISRNSLSQNSLSFLVSTNSFSSFFFLHRHSIKRTWIKKSYFLSCKIVTNFNFLTVLSRKVLEKKTKENESLYTAPNYMPDFLEDVASSPKIGTPMNF